MLDGLGTIADRSSDAEAGGVAGRVVEVVSGKPFDQFLAERIFTPLGMQETSFHPTAELQKRLAKLYQPTADKKEIEPGTHWLFNLAPDLALSGYTQRIQLHNLKMEITFSQVTVEQLVLILFCVYDTKI